MLLRGWYARALRVEELDCCSRNAVFSGIYWIWMRLRGEDFSENILWGGIGRYNKSVRVANLFFRYLIHSGGFEGRSGKIRNCGIKA